MMGLYNFKKRFETPIKLGFKDPHDVHAKLHTIRAPRRGGREDKPGNRMFLYVGLRQRGAHKILEYDPICSKRESIVVRYPNDVAILHPMDAEVYIGGFLEHVLDDVEQQRRVIIAPESFGLQMLSDDEREAFARHDGFTGFQEMLSFWQDDDRLPFYGHIFHWKHDTIGAALGKWQEGFLAKELVKQFVKADKMLSMIRSAGQAKDQSDG